MRRKEILLLLSLTSALSGHANETQKCATSLRDLRVMLGDPAFALTWEESSMGDGKPLVVSIGEKNGALLLLFTKTGEGLWAESAGALCQTGADLEIRFTRQQIRVGPAAGWVVRHALGGGGTFTLTTLGAQRLRIATSGWDGIFVPLK
jgi:hypothetical protein